MPSPLPLEIPAFGARAAHDAVVLGASRIELNASGSYAAGGLTPSVEDFIQFTTSHPSVPVRIMIRPRGPPSFPQGGNMNEKKRDFIYTPSELSAMESSIQAFKETGLMDLARGDGFVFGILSEDDIEDHVQDNSENQGKGKEKGRKGRVNESQCTHLIALATPYPSIFHRAFDELLTSSPESWASHLSVVTQCGFTGILTSGGLGRAVDNMDMLGQILDRASVEIIVGGGVRRANVGMLVDGLGLRGREGRVVLHSACLGRGEDVDGVEVQGIVARLS